MRIRQGFFKQEPGEEPVGKVIQPYDFSDIPSGALIVPWTGFESVKQTSGEVFSCEDAQRINTSAKQEREMFQPSEKRSQETDAAIDRKHPERGLSCQPHFPSPEGTQGSKCDFKAPAKEPAL